MKFLKIAELQNSADCPKNKIGWQPQLLGSAILCNVIRVYLLQLCCRVETVLSCSVLVVGQRGRYRELPELFGLLPSNCVMFCFTCYVSCCRVQTAVFLHSDLWCRISSECSSARIKKLIWHCSRAKDINGAINTCWIYQKHKFMSADRSIRNKQWMCSILCNISWNVWGFNDTNKSFQSATKKNVSNLHFQEFKSLKPNDRLEANWRHI